MENLLNREGVGHLLADEEGAIDVDAHVNDEEPRLQPLAMSSSSSSSNRGSTGSISSPPPTPPYLRSDQKQRIKSLLPAPSRSIFRSHSSSSIIANISGKNSNGHPGSSNTRIPHSIPFQDWQLAKSSLCERGQYLLESGLWSDCSFIVGLSPNIKIFKAHRIFLAMSSPVFEAMFYGGLSENEDMIKILDVQPDAFYVMLQYIYTDHINLNSFELVCDICYAAKKYMLPALVEECTKYLWRDLCPRNACRAYEFAKLFDEPVLMEKSLQIIRTQTKEVLSESTFEDVEHSTLIIVLSQGSINTDEVTLYEAMLRWSNKECERRGLEATPDKKRFCLGDALFYIRYLTLTASQFASGPAKSGLLTQQESFSILMNISSPGSWDLPDYMSTETEVRRLPAELLPAEAVNLSTRFFCTRAMMQEPHCLNTSILDCAVTFTVDRDMYIHGIEVPSQVSENVPEHVDVPNNNNNNNNGNNNGNEYNELLYSHLLDADGNRLTYTHFTAKVSRNAMIEIIFNRSVAISANKVYRIGMVLNKVGWYPMGVCTRRVNCEGCFFTFCVGQPTDTLRDGLIRSIIFSK